jgi:hypothetical protein
MALEPVRGRARQCRAFFRFLFDHTRVGQGLDCANHGEIVGKAKALNAEGAKVSAKAAKEGSLGDESRFLEENGI